MAARLEVYKCLECGNIVEVLHGAGGNLQCCGTDLVKMQEKTADQGMEKHVPVVEKIDGGVKVTVGSVAHPMDDDHYIEWIEIIADGRSCIQYLEPGQAPEAVFKIDADSVKAREHCTKHGLWQGE